MTINKQPVTGVDIGGTKIVAAKVLNGSLAKEIWIPTYAHRSEKEITEDIIECIRQVTDRETSGIGIGVPGLIDEKQGIIYDLTNIPSWKKVHLKDRIEEALKIPVFISNDANCFALGEKTFGKGKEYSSLVGITMGTGVGAGIIINGKLHSGMLSVAGEVGGIKYLDKDYEYYCSGKFFRGHHGLDAVETYCRACNNDEEALKIFAEYGQHVGELIKTVLLIYGPEAIILGGSLTKAYDFFYDTMIESVASFPYKKVLSQISITNFTSEKIPLLGAAALALQNTGHSSKLKISIP